MTLAKAGDGSVPDEAFNAVVDAIGQGPPEHTVRAADIDSQAAADGTVLTADGAGGASFEEAEGGGSQTVKAVDLGVVTVPAIAVSGIRTLYTPTAGEFIASLRFGNAVTVTGAAVELIFDIAAWRADNGSTPYGDLSQSFLKDSSYSIFSTGQYNAGGSDYSHISPPLLASPITATLGLPNTPSALGATPGWQANHAYLGTTGIVAAGHYWDNDGPGTSGGSTPNFAGNLGGSVADGPLTWYDEGSVAAGSVHAYIEVWTPAVP